MNDDFTDITEPTLLFDFGTAAIDGDIIYDDKTGEYILFFKDEGRSVLNKGFRTRQGVMIAVSKSLTGPYEVEWRHVQKEGQYPVEGSSVFPLIGSDEYILMYDCYAQGYYQFCKSSDLRNFTFVQNTPTSGSFTPRHGSVMQITDAERGLLEAWSGLATAVRGLTARASDTMSTSELEKRDALAAEADELLRTSTDMEELRAKAQEIEGF